ncbi:ribosome biogenesis/translation initiation ATPase RLI [Candidatus Woesearchaeota archaeon]|nr:ribosome biogenesis/translation initiation ATPase RLI [Candidatus Woesearchaeota archaeon]
MTRIAIVRRDRCSPQACGNYLCIRVCPVNKQGADCIVKGLDTKAQIIEETCIGCNICVVKCPFDAISIINLPEQLDNSPIHRFGTNKYALYSLPTPIFGKVVGIVGMNGIGKSTAIKILAGLLQPNLGETTAVDYKRIIDFFKGTETQAFFEKVKQDKIKISYKPQHVDLIPKTTSGKVIDLLKKVDEKNQTEKIAELLDIQSILQHDIKQISGGELQRVAIAACVLRRANLYVFDEPTSYLDINQRLQIARFIKDLANEDTAVIVIEHDLIALDYMADVVHIMYGKEGCYGIVSQPKAAKAGLNTYLEGFLKEENMRFRELPIKFEIKAPFSTARKQCLTSWNNFDKQLDKFKLSVNAGEIYKQEIIGILGQNGIGKTTFVKILAGIMEPDDAKIDLKMKVSYKPQYIENNSEELVINILHQAIAKYSNEIIKPLELEPLFTKQINQLSGGELQRVAIAECLARDATLFLLDEPSAYLDVEQRLSLSKIMRNLVETKAITLLVVDHDLLFLDYLSDRLLVFTGAPSFAGTSQGPFAMEQGMNTLLKEVNITLRRDEFSGRPRINKPGSQLDREQKQTGKYYYG